MARCPNCDRETQRTKDWACRWCGYPLFSGSYRKIDKTYKQLKQEELEALGELEAEAVAEPEAEAVTEPVAEAVAEAEPEAVADPVAEEVVEAEPEAVTEPEAEVVEEPEPEAATEPEAEVVEEPEPEAVAETNLEVFEEAGAVIEITAEGLLATYGREGLAADERLTNKSLKLTGIVAKVVINEIINRYEIALSGEIEHELGDIQCTFDQSHVPELKQIETGQTVTVQGQYGGFVTNILIKDCMLVN